ncbi:MAG TPA: GNAT family N-acetyltransferase [Rhizomicrobium sp.]
MTVHPLDRPVWNALTTRQAYLARGPAHALRFDPDHGLFAAAADPADGSGLAALIPAGAAIALVETRPIAPPPGTVVIQHRALHQMIAERIAPDAVDFAVTPLDDGDAAEMLALATRTEPGPFFRRTHQLGDFIGVKADGKLVAMAGERMKPTGFTEVSGVCTLPAHRGKGYAGGLMRITARRIADRGETPFLHVWADNKNAIALYETLGYRLRRALTITILAQAQA